MLLSELYTPKQVLHYICPIAISLATDRVADVRIIAFKLVGTNNHSFIRATINSRSLGNVRLKICVFPTPRWLLLHHYCLQVQLHNLEKCIYIFVILWGKANGVETKISTIRLILFFPFLLIMGFRLPCCRSMCCCNDSMNVLRRDLSTNMSVI